MDRLKIWRWCDRRELQPGHDQPLLQPRQSSRLGTRELADAFEQWARRAELGQGRSDCGAVVAIRVESNNPRVARKPRPSRFIEAKIQQLQECRRLLRPPAAETIVGLEH